MRRFLLLAMLALPALSLAGECVVVTSGFQPASPNIQISVLKGDKPAGGVVVRLISLGTTMRSSISTDAKGIASFTKLAPGDYVLLAAAETNEEAELDVTDHTANQPETRPSLFSMSLGSKFPLSGQQLDEAERRPAEISTGRFAGQALDPVGGVIEGADVWIIPKGARDSAKAVRLKADADGRFAMTLPDGTYTVVIQQPGFRSKWSAVDIQKGKENHEFVVTLQISRC